MNANDVIDITDVSRFLRCWKFWSSYTFFLQKSVFWLCRAYERSKFGIFSSETWKMRGQMSKLDTINDFCKMTSYKSAVSLWRHNGIFMTSYWHENWFFIFFFVIFYHTSFIYSNLCKKYWNLLKWAILAIPGLSDGSPVSGWSTGSPVPIFFLQVPR